MNLNKKTVFRWLLVAAMTFVAIPVNAQLTAANAFRTIPDKVLDHFDENMRLDLIDYANASLPNTVKNRFGSESSIKRLSENYLDLEISPSVNIQIAILPIRERKIIAVISTVMTPAPDSRMKFFAGNWAPIDIDLFSPPKLDDWLTPAGKKNATAVVDNVPFLMTGYHYEAADMTLTISLNLNQYLTVEAFDEVKSLLHPELTYKWNGKRFVLKDSM